MIAKAKTGPSDTLLEVVHQVGPEFAARAAELDDNDRFVAENYQVLKSRKLFSAMVPADLGGGGAGYAEMCAALRALAGYCSSTALAFAMHQHVIALTVCNHLHGRPGKAMLEKVAAGELVVVSTGGNDWLESNGTMTRAEGGFRVTAHKPFASGCLAGDLLSTSARYDDPQEGPQVLHFPVAFASEGVSIQEDWATLGMRATGSHTVVFDNVFVPEDTVVVRRPRGKLHTAVHLVAPSSLPMIMSVYLGAAERAAEIAREKARGKAGSEPVAYLLGEMENLLTTAHMAVESMVALNSEFRFEPSLELTDAVLRRKTIAQQAVLAAAEKALEAAGGSGFYRKAGLERILRDVHAAQFHPMPPKQQHRFTGRVALGLEPIG